MVELAFVKGLGLPQRGSVAPVCLPRGSRWSFPDTRVREQRSRRGLVRMNFGGGGFLGVGPAEVIVIVLVGWVVLGPKELLRVSKEIGSALGQIRQSADEARKTLTSALEMEALEEEYNKTIQAFNTGYQEGVKGESEKESEKSEKTDKEKAEKEFDDAVDEILEDAAGEAVGEALGEVVDETLNDEDEDEKEGKKKQPKADADPEDESDETLEDIAVADNTLDDAALRFQEQVQRLQSADQSPPENWELEANIPDLEIEDDEIRTIELEYIDERAKLELEQLDRKYAEMKNRIIAQRAERKQELEKRHFEGAS